MIHSCCGKAQGNDFAKEKAVKIKQKDQKGRSKEKRKSAQMKNSRKTVSPKMENWQETMDELSALGLRHVGLASYFSISRLTRQCRASKHHPPQRLEHFHIFQIFVANLREYANKSNICSKWTSNGLQVGTPCPTRES